MSVRDAADPAIGCCTPGIRVIEAIRAELDALRMHVDRFEQAEAVLRPLFEPVEQSAQTEPRAVAEDQASTAPPRKQVSSEKLCEYVLEHAPVTRSQLIAALGGSPDSIDKKLRRLVSNGEIGVKGKRHNRLYGPSATAHVVSMPSLEAGTAAPVAAPPERGVYPMHDAIGDLGGATTEQLAKRLGLPTSAVMQQGRRLLQLGLARFTEVGDARLWLPAQSDIGRNAA